MLRNVARVIVLLAAVSGLLALFSGAARAVVSSITVSRCGGPNRYDSGRGVAGMVALRRLLPKGEP
jgi:hypothetical protein